MKEVPEKQFGSRQTASGRVSRRRLNALVGLLESYQTQIANHRQKLEEVQGQLRDSYRQYEDLYELAPVGFLTLDRQGCIRELNEKAARMVGFPARWLIHRPFLVFVRKEDVRSFISFLTRSIHNTELQTIEVQLLVDGRCLPVHISMRTSNHAGAILHRMTVVDLTDTRRTQNQLEEALHNWHSLVENAPDVIMTLDKEGKILFANKPAWGCSAMALVGTRVIDYIPEGQRPKLNQCIEEVFTSADRTSCEIAGLNGESEAWFSFTLGPIRPEVAGPDGTTTTTTLMIREVSEQKRTEETLRTSTVTLREFAARLERVREEERTRVAREVHDEVGQALTILKLDLSWLASKTPRKQEESRKKMKSMMLHVDETIQRVRKIASDLRPSILDDLGLIPAIEWQLSDFQKRTGIRCGFHVNMDKSDFEKEKSAAVFRVIQEALTNVLRHAEASAVDVSFKIEENILEISVSDNGKGITVEEISDVKSLGIVGMRERISRLGGELRIQSRNRGRGTHLNINLPI